MGFYIRKSMKLGPIRLNLSKSGLGVSAGVKGARIGINSRGQAYTHVGRYGLYHRQTLGATQSRVAAAPTPSGRTEIREDTGATYDATVFAIKRPSLRDKLHIDVFPRTLALSLIAVCVAIAWIALPPSGMPLTPGRIAILGLTVIALSGLAWITLGGLRSDRGTRRASTALSEIVADSELSPTDIQRSITTLFNQAYVTPTQRTSICAEAYLSELALVVQDGRVTNEELDRLAAFERAFGMSPEFVAEACTNAFHEAYLEAVSDHELSEIEEASLREIRTRLNVPTSEIAGEREIVKRLSEVRQIRNSPELQVIESGIKLQKGEVCYFKSDGRLFKDKILRRFQENGQKYDVRGLVVEKEGQLFITNKRLLLVHSGTSTIRHNKIIDLDIDYDRSLLIITKDGVQKPRYIGTPDPLRAGAILANAAGL